MPTHPYFIKSTSMMIRIVLLVALLLTVSGCGGLFNAQTDFYLLMPIKGESLRLQKIVPIGFSTVELPKYLESSRIVTAQGPYRLKQAAGHLWAEALAENIERVVGLNLTQRLGLKRVYSYPKDRDAAPVVNLRVEHLMGSLEAETYLDMQIYWAIYAGKARLHEARFSVKRALAGPAYNDFVTALSQELARMSDEIAVAIVKTQQ